LTKDNYPRYGFDGSSFSASKFDRKDLDLTGRWVVSGASTLEGRLSTGRSRVTSGIGTDFSGVTGMISWAWQPVARWNFSATASTGLETSFLEFNGNRLNSDLNRVTTAGQLNANYELTSKILLNAGASVSKSDRTRDLFSQNDFDRDTALNFGARYQYSRGVQFACQLSHQARSSSTAVYVYSANSYGCNGQLIIN